MPTTSSAKGALDFPGLVGVCLAVNAVPGCALGPGGEGPALDAARRMIAAHDRASGLSRPPEPLTLRAPEASDGDWLDGYARTLEVLAGTLELSGGAPRPENVALVGYLMDRNEGDHHSNIDEMERMLSAMSLRLVSTWLGGRARGSLEAVRDAGTLLALPHGRGAARLIAARTGARVVDVGLPFGLAGTERWVRAVGGALGRAEEAEALLSEDLGRAARRLEWLLPRVFLGRRVGFIGDPWYLGAFAELCEELGCKLTLSAATCRRAPEREAWNPGEVLWRPSPRALAARLREPLDLLVSSSNEAADAYAAGGGRVLEFGFPSYRSHAAAERPCLGFRGALGLVDRMAQSLEVSASGRRATARRAAPGRSRARRRKPKP